TQRNPCALVVEIGGAVDGARVAYEVDAVGGKSGGANRGVVAEVVGGDCRGDLGGPCVEVADERLGGEPVAGGRAGEELHGAAERGVAPRAGAAATHDLGGRKGELGECGPGDPAAEGVVEGNAAEQDERTTRAARAESAERNALGGGVRGEASAAAEKTEGGR